MSDWESVPPEVARRIEESNEKRGRVVEEVFWQSHVGADCPKCGESLRLNTVYHRGSHLDDPEEVAHLYDCRASPHHEEGHRWIYDLQTDEWYLENSS